jgi:hypothetical protein
MTKSSGGQGKNYNWMKDPSRLKPYVYPITRKNLTRFDLKKKRGDIKA